MNHNLLASESVKKDEELSAVKNERDKIKVDLQNKTRGHEMACAQVTTVS